MSQLIEVDHIYSDPDVYDITYGRSSYESAFDAQCMLEILDRNMEAPVENFRALEIASGVYSRYELPLQEYLPRLTRIKNLELIKTDFVGDNGPQFQVVDVCRQPMPSSLQLDCVLAPFHTLHGMMDLDTFDNSVGILENTVRNSANALRTNGLFIIHLGEGNGTLAHQQLWKSGNVLKSKKFVPYTSSLRKYGDKCNVKDTSGGLHYGCLLQKLEVYFPQTKTRIVIKHDFKFLFLSNAGVADVFEKYGLELVQGYKEIKDSTVTLDVVKPVNDLNRASWLLFRKRG